MKKTHVLLINSCLWLGLVTSCNVVETLEDGNPTLAPHNKLSHTTISYEDYQHLSVEEQWRSFTPNRRNFLRENPTKYPRFKRMIMAEPNMEQQYAQPTPPAGYEETPLLSTNPPTLSPAEKWAKFSLKRKQYIKNNIEKYPEYKPFIN